jgi:hypothetical protein
LAVLSVNVTPVRFTPIRSATLRPAPASPAVFSENSTSEMVRMLSPPLYIPPPEACAVLPETVEAEKSNDGRSPIELTEPLL